MKDLLKTLITYFTSWSIYQERHFISDIQCAGITHINYAFADILNESIVVGDPHADLNVMFSERDGEHWRPDKLYGNFGELFKLKQRCPLVKTYISIGGWTWSKEFSSIAASAAKRVTFVKSCMDFLESYGFDGIDLDWEYPGGQGLPSNGEHLDDGSNYVLLLKEFQRQIHSKSIGISVAVPCLPSIIDQFPLKEMYPLVDHFNVMCYDFGDPEKDSKGRIRGIHHSNLRGPYPSVEHGIKYITERMLKDAGDKLVVGLPLYGRSYYNCTGGPGSWCEKDINGASNREPGVWDYKHLPIRGCQKKRDSKGTYCINPVSKRLIFWDDKRDIQEKISFCKEEKSVSGLMWWENSQDIKGANGVQHMLSMHHDLSKTKKNRLCYPNSPFLELRLGCKGIPEKSNTSIDTLRFIANSVDRIEREEEIFRDERNWNYLLHPKGHYNHGRFVRFVKNNRELFTDSFKEKFDQMHL